MQEVSAAHRPTVGGTCFDHAHSFELRQGLRHFLSRPGPHEPQLHEADFYALVAQVLDRMPGRHRMGTHDEEADLGIFGHVLFHEGRNLPPENPVVIVNGLLDHRGRIQHRLRPLQVHDRPLVRANLRPVGNGTFGIQRVRQRVRRQKLVHLALVREHHLPRDVRHEVPVLADELGKEHAVVLTDAIIDQAVIERLLRILGPSHEPALIPARHGIGVFRPEVARGIQRAVGDHHLQGDAPARDRRIGLERVGHAHPGASRQGAGPRRRSAEHH